MDPYLGEIRLFSGNFAPKDWALCNGQLLSIAQNTALFSLLGTSYGGNGTTHFALPDLQGRAPMHQVTPRAVGVTGGSPTVTLLLTDIPSHTHAPNSQSSQGVADPTNAIWTNTVGLRGPQFYGSTPDTLMNPQAIQASGGNQPHNNMQPYLGLNFIIALVGIFPPRS